MIFMIYMIEILSGNNDTVAIRHKAESLTAISAGQRPVSADRTRPLRPDGATRFHSSGMDRSVERHCTPHVPHAVGMRPKITDAYLTACGFPAGGRFLPSDASRTGCRTAQLWEMPVNLAAFSKNGKCNRFVFNSNSNTIPVNLYPIIYAFASAFELFQFGDVLQGACGFNRHYGIINPFKNTAVLNFLDVAQKRLFEFGFHFPSAVITSLRLTVSVLSPCSIRDTRYLSRDVSVFMVFALTPMRRAKSFRNLTSDLPLVCINTASILLLFMGTNVRKKYCLNHDFNMIFMIYMIENPINDIMRLKDRKDNYLLLRLFWQIKLGGNDVKPCPVRACSAIAEDKMLVATQTIPAATPCRQVECGWE
jgi:hypothetical protein